jgi:flagellar assembly protein FliH
LAGHAAATGFAKGHRLSARPASEEPSSATAEEVLQAAREQAAAIVEAGKTEAAGAAQHAAAEAREEQLRVFQAAADDLMQAVREQVQETLQRLEREAAVLAVQIARRVTAEHFQAQPEAIVAVVREALQQVGESARVRVVVAPQHEEPLRQAYRELAALLGGDSRLEISVSDAAEPLGCVVHGDHASFDARLGSRLQAIEQMVQETVTQQAA